MSSGAALTLKRVVERALALGVEMSVLKATDEMRYTLGVVYVPNRLDAHDEFTQDEDLHRAVISYMASSDRRLRRQHSRTQVGTVVEMMRWPYEATIELAQKAEEPRSVTLPPGTVYMGVIWDEGAWPDVKAGRLNGFSLGGTAVRVRDVEDAPIARMGSPSSAG